MAEESEKGSVGEGRELSGSGNTVVVTVCVEDIVPMLVSSYDSDVS